MQLNCASLGSNSSSIGINDNTFEQVKRLSTKKQKYLKEVIEDKNGVFNYKDNPVEYKKARKYEVFVFINWTIGDCRTERALSDQEWGRITIKKN